MRVLSLFSGIGAHDLGLEWAGMRIVGQIEIDEYCSQILQKHWAKVPRWRDITTVSAHDISRACGHIDVITGGFPCQDISTAGKRAGLTGSKSSLWWHMWRLILELRPAWLLIENVPRLRIAGADTVFSALETIGYSLAPVNMEAADIGAEHHRARLWTVAHLPNGKSNSAISRWAQAFRAANGSQMSGSCSLLWSDSDSAGLWQQSGRRGWKKRKGAPVPCKDSEEIGVGTNPDSKRRKRQGRSGQAGFAKSPYSSDQWDWEYPRTVKSPVGRSVHGAARRLALKALGNCNPPQVTYVIGRAIMRMNEALA